jgi:hypothetical protein
VVVPVNQQTRQPLAVNTVRALQWAGKADQYMVRVGDLSNMGWVTTGSNTATKTAANFTVVAGLADPTCFSFTAGGRYLRHSYFRLRWDFNDGSRLFTKDTTFCARTGAVSGSILLESKNYPNYFVTKVDDELWIKPAENTAAYRTNTSFYSVTACT